MHTRGVCEDPASLPALGGPLGPPVNPQDGWHKRRLTQKGGVASPGHTASRQQVDLAPHQHQGLGLGKRTWIAEEATGFL